MAPLQIEFDSLIDPSAFTTSVAMLIGVILILTLYASIQLRSMFGIFGFMLMIVTLVGSITVGISFLWFWITVLVESFIIFLAATVYVRASARGKY